MQFSSVLICILYIIINKKYYDHKQTCAFEKKIIVQMDLKDFYLMRYA